MMKTTAFRAGGACLVAVLAVGCDETGEREEMQRQLDRNRARWEALALTSYAVHERVSCYCVFGPDEVIVTVDGGEIVSVTHAETGQPVDTATARFYYTVDDLFDMLERAIREADSLHASYDQTFFFPTEIAIDWIEPAIDDEISVEMRSLVQ